ncbi:MAG: class I SAM-dependent methyltransferase [Candidatus Omnitrophota bacterium]|nr:class I SAM-dependent methyltransferase [Candidatus Omnitrophota bacterium]
MLNVLYKSRFTEKEIVKKKEIWKILCQDFFQRYIPEGSVVLDLGAGFGEFINNIKCREKYALDMNQDSSRFINPEVKFFNNPATDLSFLPDEKIDVVFASNILEHLETKDQLFNCFLELRRVLKKGGKVIILGPNMRFVYKEYWDFIDHRLPLSDRSIAEILQMMDFNIERIISRFLPYTTKSGLSKNPALVRLYLRMPLAWRVFGKQMLVIARK